MPYPKDMDRTTSDQMAIMSVLPEGVVLSYTVFPSRTFDVALEVKRSTKQVWVTVYSARYPHNFDRLLPYVVNRILYALTNEDLPDDYAYIYDERRPSKRVHPPACRSCFDCVSDVHPLLGLTMPVRCHQCNNQSGFDAMDEQNNLHFNFPAGTPPSTIKEIDKHIKREMKLRAQQKFCVVCMDVTGKKCSRCGVVHYCCRACQQSDWKNHKKDCKPVDVHGAHA
jgi:hypothetical protein